MISVEEKRSAEAQSRQRDVWLSPRAAAEIAGVHRTTVLRWCHELRTPFARRVRGHWRVDPLALARLLEGEGNEGVRDEAA